MRRETSGLCRLDQVRLARGANELQELFYQAGEENQNKVIDLINDFRLRFVTLYILLPQIKALSLLPQLNQWNTAAVKLSEELLSYEKREGNVLTATENHGVLAWMWETGIEGDGMEDDFDELMDLVASLLVNQYKEESILPKMTEMIFHRNQRDLLIHNLVWVLFSTENPATLEMIAPYLNSPNSKDRELARHLLNLTQEETYQSFMQYYRENKPYFYYTGESMFQKSDPMPFQVDLKKKYASVQYLGKGGILS